MSDTLNKFLVTSHQGKVVILNPSVNTLVSREDAVNLAAWLIVMGDTLAPPDDRQEWRKPRESFESDVLDLAAEIREA